MRSFRCVCGNQVFFENTHCFACGRTLGFLPEHLEVSGLEPDGDAWQARGTRWKKCYNYSDEYVCNWMVRADSDHTFCDACRLNRTIPNLGDAWNRLLWSRIEAAKRRLIYDLLRLGLPFASKVDDPASGLAFQFLADAQDSEFANENADGRVMTGHANGVITINIAEADDVARERMRVSMNEGYRTLLGHFRHESGHYFWDRLIRDDPARLAAFREYFGDERADYQAALARHYDDGPPQGWQNEYISAYASSHPWEDWGESWAHFLQMSDALETAATIGLGSTDYEDFDGMVSAWLPLTIAINDLNRSMGLADAYPFALNGVTTEKLRFVDRVVRETAQSYAR